jgi:hypothetical protein
MTKWGWKNITEQFFNKFKLVHDNVTFGSKYRELRKKWQDYRDLQIKQTGLGRATDGSVSASDEWWQENNKVHLFVTSEHVLSLSLFRTG